ncbi:MAG: flagellar motor switch protein FliN [Rhodothermus sp.]|nr:flagellar motor switch protein FliN [Rhodothermus sp.]
MSSNPTLPQLETSREALQQFLQTLLKQELSLEVGTPVPITSDQLGELVQHHILIWASSEPFAIGLTPDWIPLLSQAMLGEALHAGDEGADDLLSEVAAQGYGTLRNALAAEGMRLPEVTFVVHQPGAEETQPPVALPSSLLQLPFTLRIGEARHEGFVLLPPDIAQQPSDSSQSRTTDSAQQEAPSSPVEVRPAAFGDLGPERLGNGGTKSNLELLADVELEVVVELGRRRLPLADVLRLTTGSIIELEKLVGEPLEIYANGRLIAEGEAVVIDEQFGVRITSLVTGTRHREKTLV